ncbi:MAG: hypothetical protein RL607_1691 [Bacteroidota bacterium]|jgi:hypothetical protein
MSFIDNLTKQEIENGKFPLAEILKNSIYYPSSGFDGGIIRDCNTLGRDLGISSFIYCDYASGEQAFRQLQNSFLGYNVIGSRNVKIQELIPNGWQPQIPPSINVQDYTRYREHWDQFCVWSIYERDKNRAEDHGPNRFSLFYIGGEGVATYQALYWSNNFSAKGLAIIQPGTGFGFNWTDFTDKDGALSWVVNNNPSGQPEIIYYGGYGQCYDDFKWPNFCEVRTINPYYHNNGGEVRIWKKSKSTTIKN